MAGTVQCPNCKQSVTSDNEFCIFCGTKLSAAVCTPGYSSTLSGGYKKGIKKCKNGHEFDDASLLYCSICGLPLEGTSAPSGEKWTCSCGHMNPADNAFCEECGRPKEADWVRRVSPAETKNSTAFIPEGMYTPTDDDLRPKKRSGRR